MSVATARDVRWFDPWLVITGGTLLGLGLVMVASASMMIAERAHGDTFYYLERQVIYAAVGCLGALVMSFIPLRLWERFSTPLLLAAFALLVAVLIPGVGREVNGSTRWLVLGPLRLQASEPARLFIFLFVAGYLVRRREEVETTFKGLAKPMALTAVAALLLLAEPDFGAATVLVAGVLAMLFVGGARVRDFSVLLIGAIAVFAVLALTSPYRMARLTAFLDPWADPFDSGFQLTQSLIAIGRGGWLGVGLGEGVQKLFYLPEAHTDFVFAVLAEELGLLGSLAVIALYTALVWRAFVLGRQAAATGQLFGAYLAIGIGTWLGLQAFLNIGVNMGLLPTKGLTLPLLSSGGSSLLATCAALGLLLRVAREVELSAPTVWLKKEGGA
ncbi:MAG TPA: putative lipid II flippase FtsW [Gammaproteobacteria bacterium]|nr:putative lipid II flippase FtsW [Gammaproteobacteria bacterium]